MNAGEENATKGVLEQVTVEIWQRALEGHRAVSAAQPLPKIHGNSFRGHTAGSSLCSDSDTDTRVPVAVATVKYLWKWFAYDWGGNLGQLKSAPCPQIMNADANSSADLLPPEALLSVCCRNLHETVLLSIFTRCRFPITQDCVTSHCSGPVMGIDQSRGLSNTYGCLSLCCWNVGCFIVGVETVVLDRKC